MAIHKTLTGLKFGRLTVMNLHHKQERTDRCGCFRYFYKCKCDCGKSCVVAADCLKNKHVQSCGCLQAENGTKTLTKHGLRFTKPYRTLISMIERCENPNRPNYKYYGGRGIKVCKEWHSPTKFYDWAVKNGHKPGLSIERIDVNGDYCPENCRWATPKEQANNRRNTHYVIYNGQSYKLKDLCDILNLEYKLIVDRLYKKHWSLTRAINTPKRHKIT